VRRGTACGALAAILLLGLLPAPPAQAQSPTCPAPPAGAPWWPDPNTGPDGFRGAFNFRVPLCLAAPPGQALAPGTAVQAHLDLGRAAIQGGWPKAANGDSAKSFTVDPASIRLVQYTTNWLQVKADAGHAGEVPVAVSPTWFEQDQSASVYGEVQSGDPDPSTNPLYTLEWRLPPGPGAPSLLFYEVYFDVTQNHPSPLPPSARTEADGERLDGMYWVGAGTEHYGYHPGAASAVPTLLLVAAQGGATATIYTSDDGLAFDVDHRTGVTNPVTVAAGAARTYSLGVSPTHFLVRSTAPLLVATFDSGSPTAQLGSGDFVPSLQGGLRGSTFLVPPLAKRAAILFPPGPFPGFCEGPAQNFEAQKQCYPASSTQPGSTLILLAFSQGGLWGGNSPPDPTQLWRVEVQNGGEALVQYIPGLRPPGGQSVLAQAASVEGGPVGQRFMASAQALNDGGYLMSAAGVPAVARVQREHGLEAPDIFAPDRFDLTAEGRGTMPGLNLPYWGGTQSTNPFTEPFTVLALRGSDAPPSAQGQIQVQVGETGNPNVAQSTPFGGRHGLEFRVTGPAVAYPFYDLTQIHVLPGHDPNRRYDLAGDAGTAVDLGLAGVGDEATVVADRPIAVFPFGDPTRYSRFLAAKPAFLHPTISPAQWRGYLVELAPDAGGDLLFFNGQPGQELDIPFTVRNLAHWSDGATLPDTVELSATPKPAGWGGTLQFDDPAPLVADATPLRTHLHVTLPASMAPGSSVTLTVQGRSTHNPSMADQFTVVVSSRPSYGVDAWFGDPLGPHTKKSLTATFATGGHKSFDVVVKNTGSVADTYALGLALVPPQGWSAQLLADGVPVERVTLAPQASKAMVLQVTAPLEDSTPATAVLLNLASPDSSAAARLILHARLNQGQAVAFDADEPVLDIDPGGSRTFTATVTNTGGGAASVLLSVSPTLPKGWSVRFDGLGDPAKGPLTVNPGTAQPVRLVVTAPAGAAAQAVGSFLLLGQGQGSSSDVRGAVPLTAIVRAVHKLDVQAPATLALLPGAPTALQISVRNNGNGPETIEAVARGLPGGWNVTAPAAVTLRPGESRTLDLKVRTPARQAPGEVPATFEVASTQGGVGQAAVAFHVGEAPVLAVGVGAGPAQVQPGEAATRTLQLSNTGNSAQRVAVEVAGPAGWNVSAEPASLLFDAGQNRTVTLHWQVPAGAANQTAQLSVTLRGSGFPVTATVPVEVRTPQLALTQLQALGGGSAHRLAFASALLHNPAKVPLRHAQVRVLEGARVADQVEFQSIGPNGTVGATLRWEVLDTGAPVRIEWGRNTTAGFQPLGSAPIDLGSSGKGAASPAAPLLALLLVAVAAARRRGGAP
jgi:uncharacterized membrane protein